MFSFTKKSFFHVKVVEDCKCLTAERTHGAESRERLHKEKMERVGASIGAHAFL